MTISVYITSYNQKEFLKEALESVISQTLLPDEILIIDDASSDGSKDVIEEYVARFPGLVESHFNEDNQGITKCRNIALQRVKGDYVTALDGDDAFLPMKLEIQKRKIFQTGADLVFSNFYFAKNDLDNRTSLWFKDHDPEPPTGKIWKQIISREFPNGTLFRNELVRTSLMRDLGGYDETLSIYEDYDFRIRLGMHANAAFSPEPLTIYRLHGEGLSRAPSNVHIDTLSRIFQKYDRIVKELPKAESQEILNRQKAIISNFQKSTPTKRLSLVTDFKKKIKRILRS